jgi:hypothetical protein
LHEKFLPAFVEKEMKWIEIIEEEEKREGDFLLRRWPAGAKQLIRRTNCCGSAISYKNFVTPTIFNGPSTAAQPSVYVLPVFIGGAPVN